MHWARKLCIFLLLAPLIGIAFILIRVTTVSSQDSDQRHKNPASEEPQYNEKGELKRPADFQKWVFVGANIGLQYRNDLPQTTQRERDRRKEGSVGDFHNVYIRPESYESYLKDGKFPEMTVLVMDIYEAKDKDEKNVLSNGLFPGAEKEIEVAVKNSKRPDGSKTDWAYYAFGTNKAEKAFEDKYCYDCHLKHAKTDNVWVQFYPILRKRGNLDIPK